MHLIHRQVLSSPFGSLSRRNKCTKADRASLAQEHTDLCKALVAAWDALEISWRERWQMIGTSDVLVAPSEEHCAVIRTVLEQLQARSERRQVERETPMEERRKLAFNGTKLAPVPHRVFSHLPAVYFQERNTRSAMAAENASRASHTTPSPGRYQTPQQNSRRVVVAAEPGDSTCRKLDLEMSSARGTWRDVERSPAVRLSDESLSPSNALLLIPSVMEEEEAYRQLLQEDMIAHFDILYLVHCHTVINIEEGFSSPHAAETAQPSQRPDVRRPSDATRVATFQRADADRKSLREASQRRCLDDILVIKLERLDLLEQLHRLKIESEALSAPGKMKGIITTNTEESVARQRLEDEEHGQHVLLRNMFTKNVTGSFDAKPLLRQAYIQQYRTEQEEKAAFQFLYTDYVQGRAFILCMGSGFVDERRSRHDIEHAEYEQRNLRLFDYLHEQEVILSILQARGRCELETVVGCEAAVREYFMVSEVTERTLFELEEAEAHSKEIMARHDGNAARVEIKKRHFLSDLRIARDHVKEFSEEQSLALLKRVYEDPVIPLTVPLTVSEAAERLHLLDGQLCAWSILCSEHREYLSRKLAEIEREKEAAQLEESNLREDLTKHETLVFANLPQAMLEEAVDALVLDEEDCRETVFSEQRIAYERIPVDLCIEGLRAVESREGVAREKVVVHEEECRGDVEVVEASDGAIVEVCSSVLAANSRLFAARIVFAFLYRAHRKNESHSLARKDAFRASSQEQLHAASMVQRQWRAHEVRMEQSLQLDAEVKEREELEVALEQKQAACVIQHGYRCSKARKVLNSHREERQRLHRSWAAHVQFSEDATLSAGNEKQHNVLRSPLVVPEQEDNAAGRQGLTIQQTEVIIRTMLSEGDQRYDIVVEEADSRGLVMCSMHAGTPAAKQV